jgi:hypothetical protein
LNVLKANLENSAKLPPLSVSHSARKIVLPFCSTLISIRMPTFSLLSAKHIGEGAGMGCLIQTGPLPEFLGGQRIANVCTRAPVTRLFANASGRAPRDRWRGAAGSQARGRLPTAQQTRLRTKFQGWAGKAVHLEEPNWASNPSATAKSSSFPTAHRATSTTRLDGRA